MTSLRDPPALRFKESIVTRQRSVRSPKLDILRLLKSGSILDAMVDDFFANGGTQQALVQQINAAVKKAGSSWDLAKGDSNWEKLLLRVEDFSECVVPVLADAVKHCDMEMFQHALARGAHVELSNSGEFDGPPLVLAANESVQWPVSMGSSGFFEPDPRQEQQVRRQRAIARKQMVLLIEAGADVNFTDKQGSSALMECCGGLDPEGVRILLDAGAAVNDRGEGGGTPLHSALAQRFNERQDEQLCRDRLDVVKLLLQHGANPNARTFNGYTPLHLFASQRPQMPKEWIRRFVDVMLAAGARLDIKNWQGHTALLDSVAGRARSMDLTVAEVLMDVGADLSAKDWGGAGFDKIGHPEMRRNSRALLTARTIEKAMVEEDDVSQREPTQSSGFTL